ncbi:MAG TPA: Rieske 2Fe-2S domain-containing protein [Allocoleopsis sp.]
MLKNRRDFLKYMAGGAIASIAIGCMGKETESRESKPVKSSSNLATDLNGKTIAVKALLSTTKVGDRILVKSPKEKAYLIINKGPSIANYALSPVCSHRGCSVEWESSKNKFTCPCHGAEFDGDGKVTKGPAQKPLPKVKISVSNDQVKFL